VREGDCCGGVGWFLGDILREEAGGGGGVYSKNFIISGQNKMGS